MDDDNPEWTKRDFASAKGADSLSPEVLANFPRTRIGRPPKAAPKRQVTLRLDPEVLDHFRSLGAGWQSRINAVLSEAISKKRA